MVGTKADLSQCFANHSHENIQVSKHHILRRKPLHLTDYSGFNGIRLFAAAKTLDRIIVYCDYEVTCEYYPVICL